MSTDKITSSIMNTNRHNVHHPERYRWARVIALGGWLVLAALAYVAWHFPPTVYAPELSTHTQSRVCYHGECR